MDIRELRIGNLVTDTDEHGGFGMLRVESVLSGSLRVYCHTLDEESLVDYSIVSLAPVPLTSELLERMGWIKRDIEWFDKSVTKDAWSKSWYFIQFIDYEERKEIMFCGLTSEKKNHYITSKVDYVHQLQNLYWCLCGEELVLKPK